MIYRAKHVLPMNGPVIENGDVLVRGGVIEAVGVGLALAHPDEPVRDLGEAALLPGFVNAHSHLDYTSRRGKRDGLNLWEWLEAEAYRPGRVPDRQLLEAAAVVGAIECALSGVTYLADSSFSGAAAGALDAVGLRGTVYLEVFGQSAGDRYAEVLKDKVGQAGELQALFGPKLSMGISPHSIYTSTRDMLKFCGQTCAGLDLPVAMHLSETRAELDYAVDGTGPIADLRRGLGYEPVRTGASPAEYLNDVGLLRPGVCLAHCVHLSDGEIGLIGRSGVGVAHCARSNAFLGSGIAPVSRLKAAGARLGLGTDGAATCLTLDFFEEMRFAMGLCRAIVEDAGAALAKDVLRLATLGGAEAVGASGEVGSIEVGKRADLIAVDVSSALSEEDPHLSVLTKSPADVRLVLVDGEEIVRDGGPIRVDMGECRERLRGLMGRRGIG